MKTDPKGFDLNVFCNNFTVSHMCGILCEKSSERIGVVFGVIKDRKTKTVEKDEDSQKTNTIRMITVNAFRLFTREESNVVFNHNTCEINKEKMFQILKEDNDISKKRKNEYIVGWFIYQPYGSVDDISIRSVTLHYELSNYFVNFYKHSPKKSLLVDQFLFISFIHSTQKPLLSMDISCKKGEILKSNKLKDVDFFPALVDLRIQVTNFSKTLKYEMDSESDNGESNERLSAQLKMIKSDGMIDNLENFVKREISELRKFEVLSKKFEKEIEKKENRICELKN